MKLKIAIFGGSGYGGSELLRILLFHPNAKIVFVTAHEHAGKAVSDVHRNLLGLTDLVFTQAPDDLSRIPGDHAQVSIGHLEVLEPAQDPQVELAQQPLDGLERLRGGGDLELDPGHRLFGAAGDAALRAA